MNYSKAFRAAYAYHCPSCDEELSGNAVPSPGDMTVCHKCLAPSRFVWRKAEDKKPGHLALSEVYLPVIPEADRRKVEDVVSALKEKKHGSS